MNRPSLVQKRAGISNRRTEATVIIDRYILKEILSTLLGVTLVLLLIFLSARIVQIFQEAANGALEVDTILIVLGLKAVVNLGFILPLSFYLAILLALSRLYKDSEMIALSACGVGQGRVLRSVIFLAVIFALLTGLFTLYLAPWAEQTNERLAAAAGRTADVRGITAGRFKDISTGIGTIYVEEFSEDRTELRNVFGQRQQGAVQVIFTSRYGYQFTDAKTGDRYVVLENGHRYEGQPGMPDFKIIEFEKHGVRIEEREAGPVGYRRSALSTRDLLDNPEPFNVAELQGRIAPVLLSLVFAVLAVPLSRTSPRQGQYARLSLAILIYIIYTNMLNVARAWLQKGEISPWLGMWWVHALMLALGLFLFLQQSGFHPLRGRRLLPGR